MFMRGYVLVSEHFNANKVCNFFDTKSNEYRNYNMNRRRVHFMNQI